MTRFAALLLIAASPAMAQDLRVEMTGERQITYILQESGEAPVRQTHRMAPGLRGLRHLPPAREVAAALLAGGR